MMLVPAYVTLRKKSESRFMRLVAKLLAPFNPVFMERFWVTMGYTIYVPANRDKDIDWGTDSWKERYRAIICHELVHVDQYIERGPVFHALLYVGPSAFLAPISIVLWALSFWIGSGWALAATLSTLLLLPLSVGLAYGRWITERAAYQVSRAYGQDVDGIVESLWYGYLYPWPMTWMKRWFNDHPPPRIPY